MSATALREDQAVITGVGVIAPTGFGLGPHWEATLAGRSAIRRITRFDPSVYSCQLAGEAAGFSVEEHLPTRLVTQTDRMTHMALVAADLAIVEPGEVDARVGDGQVGGDQRHVGHPVGL
ncbi:MAG TPA: beta-ketoacyl synthase N-terminal-like domain-containing protein, partial [Streptosporangiaceae bacterium]|nr:beta-ketoacyl synthase N-terminal-like domain-containing protein [Streptosporangiaceae bacterium]